MNQIINKLNTSFPLHFSSPARKSAIAIIIYKENNELKLILTERSNQLKNHAGEISFPGGTYDFEDLNLFGTAIRETKEELNIDLNKNEYIGQLNDVWTLTGYIIRPFVFYINKPISYNYNSDEIQSVLDIPLSFFREKTNKTHSLITYQKRKWNSYIYNYKGHKVWGATANILNSLFS